MPQKSYQTDGRWIWECSQGHKNTNQHGSCQECGEVIKCSTAGGHHMSPSKNEACCKQYADRFNMKNPTLTREK